jgi:hypothetical protein
MCPRINRVWEGSPDRRCLGPIWWTRHESNRPRVRFRYKSPRATNQRRPGEPDNRRHPRAMPSGRLAESGPSSVHCSSACSRFAAADGVWRIAFAFDPDRRAILLVAGDKSGGSEKRIYKQLIARADRRFDIHLAQMRNKGKKSRKTLNQKLTALSPARRKKIAARAAVTDR